MHVTVHTPRATPTTITGYAKAGSLTAPAAAHLSSRLADPCGRVILVTGNTGSAKTSVTAALAAAAGTARAIVAVERNLELAIHRRTSRPLTMPSASAYLGAVRMLESNPGCLLVVDEEPEMLRWAVADPAAAGLTRVLAQHAGSPSAGLARLATLAGDATGTIVAGVVATVVHCRRPRQGQGSGPRVVLEVRDVLGVESGRFLLGAAL